MARSANEEADPVNVNLLGAEAIVHVPNALAQLVQNSGGLQHRGAGFHRVFITEHISSILSGKPVRKPLSGGTHDQLMERRPTYRAGFALDITLGVMVERCVSVEQTGWLQLRAALWPHCAEAEQLAEMAEFLAQPERFIQLVAYAGAGEPVGLVEASLRNDYVNGTESSPVAFLEGLYVAPTHRRRGIARELVSAVVEWATTRGCKEFASDAALENEVSHRVHRSLGFEETERVVYFRRALPANDA